MERISVKKELQESLDFLNKLITQGGTACFDNPIITGNCPTFDEATANYIRDEHIRLYVKTWIIPRLENALDKLTKKK